MRSFCTSYLKFEYFKIIYNLLGGKNNVISLFIKKIPFLYFFIFLKKLRFPRQKKKLFQGNEDRLKDLIDKLLKCQGHE